MSRHVWITHRASGEVIAEGPIGLFGIIPFEGNYYIARKYLKTSRLRPNWIPGRLDLRLLDETREPSIGWLYWLPNPLFFFTAFRPAVPQSSPALSVRETA